ncbi:MAG: transporter substrate-binding domain-containing protein, partial [Acidobacteria bacterium]|nr:transporter substrate-binding domain-containing protein [Acidobacteriota bacterium]
LILAALAWNVACSAPDHDGASGRLQDEADSQSESTGQVGAAKAAPAAAGQIQGEHALLARAKVPLFGDLAEIRQRRTLRVLASYGKTRFFHDRGRARGFEVEMLREYEKFLNRGMSTYDRVRIVFVPTPFDRLLEDLSRGLGDVAAAGLTITPERRRLAMFADPYLRDVREVVVVHRKTRDIESLNDLAGRKVLVRSGSSYVAHLGALSRQLVVDGHPPIEVVEADRRLVTEDLLEMVNAGVVGVTVADHHLAAALSEVLPEIVIRDDLAIHSGGEIAWAVRTDSPELRASLNAFVRRHKKGSLLGNILFKRYYGGSQWITNPLSAADRARLDEKVALFRKYGTLYGFDWLALAAQAYQESGLDQGAKSRAGAVGVMQLLPSTAAGKPINITDVHLLENNIHAGAKYLAFLRDRYFSDEQIEPAARVDLAWAAYNAGPARINRLRREAADRGFDPNKWFFNVEKIAAEQIGRETVDYVANINKYYFCYRLQYEGLRQRLEAKSGPETGAL